MILFDFRYQDPWAKENFTLSDFVQQGQAQQRYDQQTQINRKTLDTLLAKLPQRDKPNKKGARLGRDQTESFDVGFFICGSIDKKF